MKRVLTFGVLLLAIALCLSAVGMKFEPAMAESTSVVSIQPSSQTVDENQTFNITVYVNPATPVKAIQFKLSFDPALVQIEYLLDKDTGTSSSRVKEGIFLKQTGCGTLFYVLAANNTSGKISAASAITTKGCTVSTPGIAANITFIANTGVSGTTSLNLTDVILIGSDDKATTITVTNGNVTVRTTSGAPTSTSAATESPTGTSLQTATVTPASTSTAVATYTPAPTSTSKPKATPATTPASLPASTQDSGGIGTGVIVGIAAGAVILVVLAAAIWRAMHRRRPEQP